MSGGLTQALRSAQSGLLVNQQSLDVVSRNVANVNTAGYSRKIVNVEQRMLDGIGSGVSLGAITRNVDQSLLDSVRDAKGAAKSAEVQQNVLDQIQDLFGSLDSDVSLSSTLGKLRSAAASLALAPQDSLQQRAFVNQAADLAAQLRQTGDALQTLRQQTDQQISSAVTEVNSLLGQVADLNQNIMRSSGTSDDVSDLQDQRDQAIDRLSELMDIRVRTGDRGAVSIYTGSGRLLVGEDAASLEHTGNSGTTATLTYASGGFDGIWVGSPESGKDITSELRSGELAGLVALRDQVLPDLQSTLDTLTATTRDIANQVNNAGTAFPGLQDFSGSRVFTDPAQQEITLAGRGDTALILTDADGNEIRHTTIRTLLGAPSTEPPAASPASPTTTIDNLATQINTWLGSDGTASISSDGRLVISVSNGALSMRDQTSSDPTADAADVQVQFNADGDAGNTTDLTVSGFSNFFGLNDLFVDGTDDGIYDTNVLSAGFKAPASTQLQFRNSSGVLDTVNIAAGASLDDIAAAVNANASTSGLKASVIPDGGGYRLRILSDDGSALTVTETGSGGLMAKTGLAPSNAGAANSIAVRSDILANPALVSRNLPQWEASKGSAGEYALGPGDDTIVQRLSEALGSATTFATAGRLTGTSMSLSDYAAAFIGDAATQAANAQSTAQSQGDLADSLSQKSDSLRGVNLDEELSNLMLYEQAYTAAARVISVVQSMFDTLDQAIR